MILLVLLLVMVTTAPDEGQMIARRKTRVRMQSREHVHLIRLNQQSGDVHADLAVLGRLMSTSGSA
jgi:hypothetical protein